MGILHIIANMTKPSKSFESTMSINQMPLKSQNYTSYFDKIHQNHDN